MWLLISACLMLLGVSTVMLYLISEAAIIGTFQKNGEQNAQHIASQIDPVKYLH